MKYKLYHVKDEDIGYIVNNKPRYGSIFWPGHFMFNRKEVLRFGIWPEDMWDQPRKNAYFRKDKYIVFEADTIEEIFNWVMEQYFEYFL